MCACVCVCDAVQRSQAVRNASLRIIVLQYPPTISIVGLGQNKLPINQNQLKQSLQKRLGYNHPGYNHLYVAVNVHCPLVCPADGPVRDVPRPQLLIVHEVPLPLLHIILYCITAYTILFYIMIYVILCYMLYCSD